MKFLMIDSHKGNRSTPQNLHWINASKIQAHLISLGHSVDLIWSYPDVNDNIQTGYDAILFNHASRYSYVSDEWLLENSSAKLFYITNDYNLGEPVMLWSTVKKNNQYYDVIANHQAKASKVVKKYVNNWNVVNLNALITEDAVQQNNVSNLNVLLDESSRSGCIYYGSYRADRVKYFQKYFNKNITVSTHVKNRFKFVHQGIDANFIDRLNWSRNELSLYNTSLYIEDETTHEHYSCLANRFYEAVNHDTFPLFDANCRSTIQLSGYDVPEYAMVDTPDEVDYITNHLPEDHVEYLTTWRKHAVEEKRNALHTIAKLVTGC